jgi:hypothetical protein
MKNMRQQIFGPRNLEAYFQQRMSPARIQFNKPFLSAKEPILGLGLIENMLEIRESK